MFVRIAVVLLAAAPALAQPQYLLNDRTNDAIYRVIDQNLSNFIDEPGEINIYFNAANVPGTAGPNNPTCLAVHESGVAVMGDQGNGNIYRYCDRNFDGDAQDADESIVFASTTGNAGAVSLAFPTGAAFDSQGRVYITNAGNGFGPDRIYRLVDGNGDGDAQDAGEITDYVGDPVFGPGNGIYSPQEIYIDVDDVGYLHDSGGTTHGIYRFEDINQNGRADDAGEFTPYFTNANTSQISVSAGFAMEPDRAHPGSLYFLQTGTGAVDQLIRLTDLDGNHSANDGNEGRIVWSTAESGFTNIDAVSLPNGDVLVTDNSAKRVIRLRDLTEDGDFMDAGERTDFFLNTGPTVGDIRQIDSLPIPGDVNADGFRNLDDITPFVDVLLGTDTSPGHVFRSDLNCDMSRDGLDIQPMVTLLLTP